MNAIPGRRDARRERGEETRNRMIEVAETLMAREGLNSVSLRRISAESGLANNAGLQYHFGDRAALIDAILQRRRAAFSARRRELMSNAPQSGEDAVARAMLEVLLLPIVEAVDGEGRHSYAAFLLQLIGLAASDEGYRLTPFPPDNDVTLATERLAALRPDVGFGRMVRRILRLNQLFLGALLERDRELASGGPAEPLEEFLDELFAIITCAALAPPPGH